MDMASLRRAERGLAQDQPARLDHALLVAAIAGAGAPGAASAARSAQPAGPGEEPLVELLVAGPGWRRALAAQRGCFSRAEAERRLNGP